MPQLTRRSIANTIFCALAFSAPYALTTPSLVRADEIKLEVSDPNAMKTNLNNFIGKSITLRLRSGEDISGVVEAVGPTVLKLGQLTGKEFYSAMIKLDEISAVIYRAKS